MINESVVNIVHIMEAVGKEKYAAYYESVVKDHTCSLHEPIKRNSLPLFRCPIPKTKCKKAGQISMLKHDVKLFSCLYIVTLHRDGDLSTFFQYENHPCHLIEANCDLERSQSS